MAEIRVEQVKKRNLTWVWLLVVVALVALALWYFNNDGVDNVQTREGAFAPPAAAAVLAAAADPWPAAA